MPFVTNFNGNRTLFIYLFIVCFFVCLFYYLFVYLVINAYWNSALPPCPSKELVLGQFRPILKTDLPFLCSSELIECC